MKKITRRLKPAATIAAVVLIMAVLVGCAGTSATKMVAGYETMGKALTRVHDTGVKLCETEKILSQEDCERIKKIYNDSRRIYIVTGDTLAFAIEAGTTDFRNPADQQYQLLSKAFADLTIQWLRLITELGLIRGK